MTPIEAARIAAAVAILRPEWPEPSLRTFLTNPEHHVARRPYQDAAVALTFVACDPASTTPARVLKAGPWWHIGKTEAEPAKSAQCPRCRDFYDPREGHGKCNRSSKAERVASYAEQMREARLEATRNLCSHGVLPRECADHRETQEAS